MLSFASSLLLCGSAFAASSGAQYTYDNLGRLIKVEPSSATTLTVSGFTPSSGPIGTSVTISGTGFSNALDNNAVRFNGTGAVTISATVTQLVVTVPAGASSGPISVTVGAITATSNQVFTVTSSLLATMSRKVHGGAGTFDLALSNVASNPTTEPRLGPAQTIVFVFNGAVTAGAAAVSEGTATVGAPTFSGNEMIVPLTGVGDAQYVTVVVSNVSLAGGGTVGGSTRIGFLAGDVNQNRVVTIADLGLVNAQLAQPVTVSNYLKDVNASGTITVADKGITNVNLTHALPAP